MAGEEDSEVQGYVDGVREGRICGWAWRPSTPHETLTVEVLIDGVVAGEAAAWLHRPDLAVAGVGDGRHGFAVPVLLDMDRLGLSRIVVRVKDGDPLPGSKLLVDAHGDVMDEVTEPDIAAFIESVLNQTAAKRSAVSAEPAAEAQSPPFCARQGVANNFIVYSSTNEKSLARDFGGPEYSYYFVARAFNPLLARLGTVHVASDPVDEVNRIYEQCAARGENCLFVYYAPPHRMRLGSRCPTMCVIAWEYSNIPTENWGDEPRNDWRRVLRHTAGAITLSEYAAVAVRQAMGDQYPVLAVPAPVWDRSQTAGSKLALRAPASSAELALDGFVFDSRQGSFRMGEAPPAPPRPTPKGPAKSVLASIDGVVFTSVFAPKDGRKNWQDMLTAFLSAFIDTPDATLVFKMIGPESYWWWETHDLLARMPPARCRVVVLQGFLPDAHYARLVGASHWVLNSSVAEGLCLPLLEFMCAGRPVVAPGHTAMADYLNAENSIIVRSDDDYCAWPQDRRCHFNSRRYRIEWESLRDSMREAYRITKSDPSRYEAMCNAALRTMSTFCNDERVAERIASFLGLRVAA
ncbi:MAG TPA: glycosyltransferase [Steroidobacteraceae bacterium]|nr:glycosyltransferase [Steroidobacteraceae bacterium]